MALIVLFGFLAFNRFLPFPPNSFIPLYPGGGLRNSRFYLEEDIEYPRREGENDYDYTSSMWGCVGREMVKDTDENSDD